MTEPVVFPAEPTESDRRSLASWLRNDRVAGALLVAGAIIGLVWANSPWSASFVSLRDWQFGPAQWHLHLSLGAWVADGLLAIFFFLIGLELKREIVAGELRNPRTALVPVVAAVGGVIAPALIFLAIAGRDPLSQPGWAIPVATDIAFALAVLAIIGSRLPSALRLFLLTLAVVDDLIGIALIAVLSAGSVHVEALAWSVLPLAVVAALGYGLQPLMLRRRAWAWLLAPAAVAVWALVHDAGIHPTIAGVLVAFAIPVRTRGGGDGLGPALEHAIRPFSASVVVPVFAMFASGVVLGGSNGLDVLAAQPVFWGVIAGLVLGKPLGIMATTWLLTRARFASLDPSLRWIDVLGMSALAGIGFTVSLLIAGITFDPESVPGRAAIIAVLIASVLAAACAALILGPRNRHYARSSSPRPDVT